MTHIPLFDLHCDTLYEAHKRSVSLYENDLALSLERLAKYPKFCQILAMWSDFRIDGDTAYKNFFEAREKLSDELKSHQNMKLCECADDLQRCEEQSLGALFLAVEGGKLLGTDLTRLDELYESGVRFLTLVWNDECAIGGSNGSDTGLTDFGVRVVKRCFELGIIPDMSHASDRLTDEVISMCTEHKKVCVATHSNSRTVCDHTRNLTDDRFTKISKLGGIVGISLAPMHLTLEEKCTVCDIVRHIEHYMSLGGEDTVCLGCDLDGVECLPEGIASVSDLYKIADALGKANYTDKLIEKVFYSNAKNFILRWLK